MVRITTYFILILSISMLAGCVKEQENLFDETAAVRLNNAIESIDSTLTNASNGWVMQYFATSESPGYTMLIKFSSNGEAVVAAKNQLVKGKYTEAKSIFDVIGDNGPVLTFNTFNDVLHIFSNPENPSGTGLEGDYEFVVNNYSDSLIQLKGKKRGTEIEMQRLSESNSWSDYFDELDKMDNQILGAGSLYFITGRDTFIVLNGSTHVFEFQNTTTNETTQIPFIITKKGLKFYAPYITSGNKNVQTFSLSDDGKLYADNDKNTYFAGPKIGSYFVNSQSTYAFDTTRMSDHFKMPIRELHQQMKEHYNGKRNVDFIALSYKTGFGNSFYLATTPTVTTANFKIELTLDPNNDVITIAREKGIYDSNGELFYTNINAIEDIWSQLDGSYKLISGLSKKEVKFIDLNDESRYFVVMKR